MNHALQSGLLALLCVLSLLLPGTSSTQGAQWAEGAEGAQPAPVAPILQLSGPGNLESSLAGLIAGARLRVLVEAYALDDGALRNALIRARERGVDVRVMLDPLGLNSMSTLQVLAGNGILTRTPNPSFGITHQNAIVVDTSVVAICTTGLSGSTLAAGGPAYAVLDRDRTDVVQVASIFYDDWLRQPVNRFGHNLVVLPQDAALISTLIGRAGHRIELYTANLSDPGVTNALRAARARGVVVRILTPLQSNNSALRGLTTAGSVRFGDIGAGTMLVIDRNSVLVGSMDLGANTLSLHRELGIVLTGRSVALALDAQFFASFARGLILQPALPRKPTVHQPTTVARTVKVGPLLVAASTAATVLPGDSATLAITTTASAAVSVTVTYSDRSITAPAPHSSGIADQHGRYTFTWQVAATTRQSTMHISITVISRGVTARDTLTAAIVPAPVTRTRPRR